MTSTIYKSPLNAVCATYLKEKRKAVQHTMRSLSQILGVPHSYIGKIENLERRLDVGEFQLYCEALGICPVEALTECMKRLNNPSPNDPMQN